MSLVILALLLTLVALYTSQILYHFSMVAAGRLVGVRAKEVSIGIGPKLYSFCRNGLTIRIACLPFGGTTSWAEVKVISETVADNIASENKVNEFTAAHPLAKMLIAFTGPFVVILWGLFLLLLPVFMESPQIVQCTRDESIIKHAGCEGLKYVDRSSTFNLQMLFFRNTAVEFAIRLVTFESLGGWGGYIAFIVTACEIGIISFSAWLSCIGAITLFAGIFSLIPWPMHNGFQFCNALLELITGKGIPDNLFFWLSCLGLFIALFYYCRMIFIDVLWVWHAAVG